MRLGKLLLVAAYSACNAAAAAPASDAAWLLDPVGAVLAEADTAPDPMTAATKTGPEGWISVDYAKLLWDDTKETATAPLHWDADEWRNFGLITGGLAISVAFLDKPIRDAAQRSRSSSADDFFRNVEKFGTKQYGLPVLFGFYAVGLAVDDYNAKTVALDGFSASVISSLTTSVFKGIAGRARPNSGLGPHHWNPFGGDQSFPSGHATGAFAFASVIAGHYDSAWVATTAYTIASLVGVARIEQDAHWASDVVAGGLIGGLIGHHLVQFNETWRENHELALEIGTDGRQLTFSWKF
ncbi:MAG TPA: phosphatase PAP2 family protein [Rhodanobacteraceae bacterium]|nr:phosphatase PAP2 family protein [Rhodanobacteraceae bacterium]